jgi:cytochrome c oxidase subunit 2
MPSPVRGKPLVLVCVILLGLLAAEAALGSNGGIAPQTPRSPNAGRIEDIYWLLLAITGAIFVLVEGALVVFVVRFRSRGRTRASEGPQIHGATRLELIWTVIPVLILAAIASFVFYKLPGIKNVPKASAADPNLKIRVEGHQYYWNFIYPNGVIQVGRMRVPAGRSVELAIHSPDVDHSWWIPSLGGKFDAIPGKVNHTWFRITRPGTYRGQCGEFCGLQHAAMLASVVALPASEFDAWYAKEASAEQSGKSDLGKMTYRGVCATCHGFKGQGGYGPVLAGNPLLGQRTALETLVRHGRGRMPAVGGTWNDRQMNALLAYVKRFATTKGGASGR